MTFEEAKKILNVELLAITLESNVSRKETQKERLNEKFKAINVALEAIDKQIPRKPIENEDRLDVCSICGYMVLDEMLDHLDYCPYCGQALDWSDTDD